MEGFLLVPPERNSILGRTLWKVRYIVLGPDPHPNAGAPASPPPSRPQSFRRQLSRHASVANLEPSDPDALYVTIYKRRGEPEIVSRYPLAALRACAVEDFASRKGSLPLPTLVLTFEPDSVRGKRRSSQSSTLSSRTRPDSLIFRAPPDDPYAILEWNRVFHAHLYAQLQPQSPFLNSNFSFSDTSSRPSTSTTRPALIHSPHSYGSNSSAMAPSAIVSPAVSLQSSFTGITSPASASPQKASDAFDALHSPQGSPMPDGLSTSPSGFKESILDRAFSMNCIPGYKTPPPSSGDEAMTSIARFEALMQEMDARRAARTLEESPDEDGVLSASRKTSQASVATSTGTVILRPRRRSRPSSLAISPIGSRRSSVIINGASNGYNADLPVERERSSTQSSHSTLTLTGNGGNANGGSASAGIMRRSISDFTWRLSSLGMAHLDDDARLEEEQESAPAHPHGSDIVDSKDGPSNDREHSPSVDAFDTGRRRRHGGVWSDEELSALI